MTAQLEETLVYNGDFHEMATEPLSDYLRKLNEKPKFVSPHTGLHRGYIGTWEVFDNELYLNNLLCFIGEEGEQAGLEYLFPDQSKVFAYWFSGLIRLPQGKLLNYVHGGYESVYEKDLFLKFEKGKFISSYIEDNRGKEFFNMDNW